ncbi:MAG: hypothetical protein ACTJLN_02870 [Rickettsia amblyommatis]
MFITMLTAQNASFISHSGIARLSIYQEKPFIIKHKNLAVKLHSFITACAKDIYSNKKRIYDYCIGKGNDINNS